MPLFPIWPTGDEWIAITHELILAVVVAIILCAAAFLVFFTFCFIFWPDLFLKLEEFVDKVGFLRPQTNSTEAAKKSKNQKRTP